MPPTNNNQSTPYVYDSGASSQPSFWRRRIVRIAIFVVLILVITVIAIAVVQRGKTPQAVAQNFANELIKGQSSQTYQQATTGLRNSTSVSAWLADVQTVGNLCTGKVTLVSNKQKSTIAQELFEATGTSGKLCHIEIDLTNTTGKWQANSLIAY